MLLRRTLSTASLAFVMFFNVSGGAFTTETIVARAGPGAALLILILVPLVWAVPETLIVGELASMLPEEGGYYRWVYRAFGPFWAFQNAWWSWLYSVVDMAIYPVLFNQYLSYFAPQLPGWTRWALSLALIWGATAINLRGAFDVGRFSMVAGGFVLTVFAVVALVAVPRITHAPWHPFVTNRTTVLGGMGVGLATALWNYIGWDNASTVQGEVMDASRSYPRALAIALPMVVLGYFIPLLPTLGATDSGAWFDGAWPTIVRSVGGPLGPTLAAITAVAGMISAVALFNALLLVYSRVPMAAARDGLLPRMLARTTGVGVPRNAIVASALCYSLFALTPFGKLVVADVLLYAMALIIEFGALIALRRREPLLRGSFRIPAGTRGVGTLAALPTLVLVLTVALSLRDRDNGLPAVVAAVGAASLGPLLYAAGRWSGRISVRGGSA
ncbi:MAG: hypothetical protein NVS9B3_13070 [Gemmatimonadaceae bacterium]